MEHEIVYVYVHSWQFDTGEVAQTVVVFGHLDDALNALEEDQVQARLDMKELDTEEDDYQKGDFSWSIWEKGEYCYNHIDLNIYQRTVR